MEGYILKPINERKSREILCIMLGLKLDCCHTNDELLKVCVDKGYLTKINASPTDNNDFKKVCPRCKGEKQIYVENGDDTAGWIDCPDCVGKPVKKS